MKLDQFPNSHANDLKNQARKHIKERRRGTEEILIIINRTKPEFGKREVPLKWGNLLHQSHRTLLYLKSTPKTFHLLRR